MIDTHFLVFESSELVKEVANGSLIPGGVSNPAQR